VKGEGNQLDFGARIYDTRIASWLSLDPLQKKYPGESNYIFTSNNPILYKDADGRDKVISITIKGTDGVDIVFKKIDKTYKNVYAVSLFGGGYSYNKADIVQNLTIDLSKTGKDMFTFTSERKNIEESSFGEWLDAAVPKDDLSDKISYGYQIYANGSGMEYQNGLPLAGFGTKSIDIGKWLDFAGGLRPSLDANEAWNDVIMAAGGIKNVDWKQVKVAFDIIYKSAVTIGDGWEKSSNAVKAIVDQVKKSHDNNESGDSAVCPSCAKRQSTEHIDSVNPGLSKELRKYGLTDQSKASKSKNK
jgi:hypothetical protein